MSDITNILSKLTMGEITQEQAKKLIEESNKQITYKVSEKGAISFYGIRKLPITLYLDEVNKLKDVFINEDFNSFIDKNKGLLKQK